MTKKISFDGEKRVLNVVTSYYHPTFYYSEGEIPTEFKALFIPNTNVGFRLEIEGIDNKDLNISFYEGSNRAVIRTYILECCSNFVMNEDVTVKFTIDTSEWTKRWASKDDGKTWEYRPLPNGSNYDENLTYYRDADMENVVELDNGEFLIKKYGKYQPDLCFLSKVPAVTYTKVNRADFNLPCGDISIIYGDYYKSKKGTDCFRVKPKDKAKHILVSDDWGGAFEDYRGNILPDNGVYYKRKRSNGGGCGTDYAIYDKDWRYRLSVDDI